MSESYATKQSALGWIWARLHPAATDFIAVVTVAVIAGLVAGVQTSLPARVGVLTLSIVVALAASFCDGLTGGSVGVFGALGGAVLLQREQLWNTDRFGWGLALCVVLVLLGWLVGVASESTRKALRSASRSRVGSVEPAYGSLGLLTPEAFEQRLIEEAGRATHFTRPLSLLVLETQAVDVDVDVRRLAERGLDRIVEGVARETDVPANLGGDLRAILLPETDEKGAWDVASTILCAIDGRSAAVGPGFADLTALLDMRIGVAVLATNDPTGEQLSEEARRAAALHSSAGLAI